eukprot:TRINITY_DN6306_c0_g1_i1.p1 TRINITY_DN6306_c0_g1~~TRINITY_DN6306_c0_g1_i1.p1  ORF type:complete len:990 (+),score=192.14 TRINITY_DN6306_c0_g1_i1:257-2971(+)
MVGTGKSTWINAVVSSVETSKFSKFHIGHSAESETEGIWVYPYPLKLSSGAQLMILDLEGMGGIKNNENQQITKMVLDKLYALGMLFSSVFVIHTHVRPDQGSIESLKNAFNLLIKQKKELGVNIPKIYLLCRDSDKVNVKDEHSDLKSLLQKSCNLDEALLSNLIIMGRPKPPEEWLKTHNHQCLVGMPYLETIKNLLRDISYSIKEDAPNKDPIRIDKFCTFLHKCGSLINSENFSKFFKGVLDLEVFELLLPFKEECISKFEMESLTLSKSFTGTVEELKGELENMRKAIIQDYDKKVAENLSLSANCPVLTNFRSQVVASLKTDMVVLHFIEMRNMKNLMQQLESDILKKEQMQKKALEKLQQNQETLKTQYNSLLQETNDKLSVLEEKNQQLVSNLEKYKELLVSFTEKQKLETKKVVDSTNEQLTKEIEIFLSEGTSDQIELFRQAFEAKLEDMKQARKTINNNEKEEKSKVASEQWNLAMHLYDQGLVEEAKPHFRFAADAGHGDASFFLAVHYFSPPTEQMKRAYIHFLQKAIDNNCSDIDTASRMLNELNLPLVEEWTCCICNHKNNKEGNCEVCKVPQPNKNEEIEKSNQRVKNEEAKIQGGLNLQELLKNTKDTDFLSSISLIINNCQEINRVELNDNAKYAYSHWDTDELNGMTKSEKAAIYLYTMSFSTTPLFLILNEALRGKDPAKVSPFLPYTSLLIQAVKKSKTYSGIVWRAFTNVDVSSLYDKGSTINWSAFTSCSTDISVCGTNFFVKEKGKNTLFNIQLKVGYDISELSAFPLESEILVLPGTYFKVIDKLEVSSHLTIIQLEQCEKPGLPLGIPDISNTDNKIKEHISNDNRIREPRPLPVPPRPPARQENLPKPNIKPPSAPMPTPKPLPKSNSKPKENCIIS